jgi:hypothetical protein
VCKAPVIDRIEMDPQAYVGALHLPGPSLRLMVLDGFYPWATASLAGQS